MEKTGRKSQAEGNSMNGLNKIKEDMKNAVRLRVYTKLLNENPDATIGQAEAMVNTYIKQKGIEFLVGDDYD